MKEEDRIEQLIIDALVVSLLAVNKYTLDRVLSYRSSFRENGLLDVEGVSKMDVGTITAKLTAAGFNRGLLNGMMAARLKNLMTAISEGYIDQLPKLILNRDRESALTLLTSLRGMGPTTARNAWLLLTK